MSLLDELRKQAEAKRLDAQNKPVTEPLVPVRPRMEMLTSYLRELVDHLNYVKPEIYASYDLEYFGRVEKLLQTDYVLGEFQGDLGGFTLSFTCASERMHTVDKHRMEEIDKMREYAHQFGLRVRVQEFRNAGRKLEMARFVFKPQFDVALIFEAHADTATIDLITRNFFTVGALRLTFKAGQIDEGFLEQLGAAITRSEHKLLDYQRTELSPEVRETLRRKMQEEAIQREIELRRPLAETPSDADLSEEARKKKKGLLGLLGLGKE